MTVETTLPNRTIPETQLQFSAEEDLRDLSPIDVDHLGHDNAVLCLVIAEAYKDLMPDAEPRYTQKEILAISAQPRPVAERLEFVRTDFNRLGDLVTASVLSALIAPSEKMTTGLLRVSDKVKMMRGNFDLVIENAKTDFVKNKSWIALKEVDQNIAETIERYASDQNVAPEIEAFVEIVKEKELRMQQSERKASTKKAELFKFTFGK